MSMPTVGTKHWPRTAEALLAERTRHLRLAASLLGLVVLAACSGGQCPDACLRIGRCLERGAAFTRRCEQACRGLERRLAAEQRRAFDRFVACVADLDLSPPKIKVNTAVPICRRQLAACIAELPPGPAVRGLERFLRRELKR